MTEGPVMLQLSVTELQQWIIAGVGLVKAENTMPSYGRGAPATDSSGQPPVAVELPAKYRRLLMECDSVSALADEIIAVSLATREVTTEWQVRMRNLGMPWIPFEFRPEWFEKAPSSEPEGVDQRVEPAPQRPADGGGVHQAVSETTVASVDLVPDLPPVPPTEAGPRQAVEKPGLETGTARAETSHVQANLPERSKEIPPGRKAQRREGRNQKSKDAAKSVTEPLLQPPDNTAAESSTTGQAERLANEDATTDGGEAEEVAGEKEPAR